MHRIGRTGRAGRHGVSVTFVTPNEMDYLRVIERFPIVFGTITITLVIVFIVPATAVALILTCTAVLASW